jgi:hypothetical protein
LDTIGILRRTNSFQHPASLNDTYLFSAKILMLLYRSKKSPAFASFKKKSLPKKRKRAVELAGDSSREPYFVKDLVTKKCDIVAKPNLVGNSLETCLRPRNKYVILK